MNVHAKLHAALEYVRDSADPYTRLVQRALHSDPRIVPFYQLDEVRAASFQSEHACDRIIRAIAIPLTAQPPVTMDLNKALQLLRVLVIEGAAGVRARLFIVRPELHRLAHMSEVRKDTVEAVNKELATALLLALDGNSESLIAFSNRNAGGNGEMGGDISITTTTGSGTGGVQKSVFQAMHERERRMYRKQCDEQKKQSLVIVQERIYGSFDGNLSPDKLVEQVLLNPKKKFARQELDSFVNAAVSTGRLEEVAAELDRQLREPRQSLQNRYKVLLVIEAIVDPNNNNNNNNNNDSYNNNNTNTNNSSNISYTSSALEEAREFFRHNSSGVCRHLQTTGTENPVKAEAARGVAQRILQSLQQSQLKQQQQLQQLKQQQSSSSVQLQQQLQLQQQQQQTVGPSNSFVNAPPSSSLQIDDLFSDLSLKKTPPIPSSSTSVHSAGQTTTDALNDLFGSADLSKRDPSITRGGQSSFHITAISSVPKPTESFYQQQQQQNREDVQPNIQTLGSVGTVPANPLVSSYSVEGSGGMWQPQLQKQSSLWPLSHEQHIEISGSNGVSEQPQLNQPQQQCNRLASSDTLQKSLGMEGNQEFQSVSPLDSMKSLQFSETNNNSNNNNEKMELLRQLQSQMEMTKLMLEQQQAAFFALQAELQKK